MGLTPWKETWLTLYIQFTQNQALKNYVLTWYVQYDKKT